MAPQVFSRREKFAQTKNQIAGGLIVGIFVFVVLLCLLYFLRLQRIKANKKRSATSIRVGGFIRPMTAEVYPRSGASIPPFSRDRLTASIVMPEKSITRKPHACGLPDGAGIPSKLAPSLPSSSNSFSKVTGPRVPSILNPAHPRHSRSSSGFSGYSQYRYPFRSSFRPFVNSMSLSQARLVQQLFEPTLPDELTLRCGEHLSVLQSFDDGWCVVARDTLCSPCSSPTRLSAVKNSGDNVDIGLVPTWVFAKPFEGVASTRPFRSTSLNALRLGQNSATRDMLTSWSNFA